MSNWAQAGGLPPKVILASKSPRRRDLLATLGIEPEVYLSATGAKAEALETPHPQENPKEYVARVTLAKLHHAVVALRAQRREGIVLAADTTVSIHGGILGKPTDAADAMRMLETLAANTHEVMTAVATCRVRPKPNQSDPLLIQVQVSRVTFSDLPKTFIDEYIASGEPFDKAGAYGIQGVIAQYIKSIEGSHSGIMGLPLYETALILRCIQAQ